MMRRSCARRLAVTRYTRFRKLPHYRFNPPSGDIDGNAGVCVPGWTLIDSIGDSPISTQGLHGSNASSHVARALPAHRLRLRRVAARRGTERTRVAPGVQFARARSSPRRFRRLASGPGILASLRARCPALSFYESGCRRCRNMQTLAAGAAEVFVAKDSCCEAFSIVGGGCSAGAELEMSWSPPRCERSSSATARSGCERWPS